MGSRLVDLGDAGMPEPGEELRFIFEAAQGRGRVDRMAHRLDGDRAAWLVLNRFVDRSHSARGDHPLDGIAAYLAQRCSGCAATPGPIGADTTRKP